MQATQGLSLEEIEPLAAHLGGRGRELLTEKRLKPGDEGLANILAALPALVDVAFGVLERRGLVKSTSPSALPLRGFLSAMILYVKALSSDSAGVKQAKYYIPLLGRTNMAKLFSLVPDGKGLPPEALARASSRLRTASG